MLALYVTGIMDMSQVFLLGIWIQRADAVERRWWKGLKTREALIPLASQIRASEERHL
jgi:hypothetical protein